MTYNTTRDYLHEHLEKAREVATAKKKLDNIKEEIKNKGEEVSEATKDELKKKELVYSTAKANAQDVLVTKIQCHGTAGKGGFIVHTEGSANIKLKLTITMDSEDEPKSMREWRVRNKTVEIGDEVQTSSGTFEEFKTDNANALGFAFVVYLLNDMEVNNRIKDGFGMYKQLLKEIRLETDVSYRSGKWWINKWETGDPEDPERKGRKDKLKAWTHRYEYITAESSAIVRATRHLL